MDKFRTSSKSDCYAVSHGDRLNPIRIGPIRPSESAAIVAFLIEKDEGSKWWKKQTQYFCARVKM